MVRDVLFEIGLEELPARFIDDAENQLVAKTKDWLDELRIGYEAIASYSTPRRLAIVINGLSETQTTIEEEIKGPAMKIAKDNEGNWSKAAIGFTKGQGKSPDDIYTKELNGTTYIYVKKHIEGKPSLELLPTFQSIIESIQFGKNMRWGEQTLRYARPIRWLVALYGNEVIPFEIASVKTDNFTFGHRFLGEKFTISEPKSYENQLKEHYVIANPNEREQLIVDGINKVAEENNYTVNIDENLLKEVRNLVEYPTVFIGSYEKTYLDLPSEVLITSMKEHQRYFPVHSKDEELLPYFIGVRNGDEKGLETVIRGNEKVLRARLSDAAFFYEEDQNNSIDFYLNKLEKVVFQEKLGTISDKVQRMEKITENIAHSLKFDDEVIVKAKRATSISKFDLMTNMVNEFTELQGIMGEKYALKQGEDKNVAQAIKEHYLPKSTAGNLPETIEGYLVSVADKLDTIVGCISVGLRPTGSQDPYALRRQAVGILRILQESGWNISVNTLIDIAVQVHHETNIVEISKEELLEEVISFMKQRAEFLLKESSVEVDIIDAVLDNEIGIFPYAVQKAKVLSDKRVDPAFKPIQEALVRVMNLAKKADNQSVNPAHFQTDSEKELFEVVEKVIPSFNKENNDGKAMEALEQLAKLAEPIHQFFEHNMVMDKDETIKNNRLGLVSQINSIIKNYANLSLIEWKQTF
ncbi:glycine--tRNA ligase subunit beta [Ornithinibacillus halophilus]|uniref:Glycine--tRNA ligase beta subunit n=1 Tax=Ornithinibacillus halophilus TaxID=930117 RepID=A0A1M5DNQ7_9BACI|nr:glycine--tRNA ligase subunit beta [Ornithinibacillus halophilus]SHF68412.1 glycyl-tRNA synthetase beta chain [Ornithinibacillus halophilus]